MYALPVTRPSVEGDTTSSSMNDKGGEIFINGALVDGVDYPPVFRLLIERPMSVRVINLVQDAVENTVFSALRKQSGTSHADWPLAAGARARSFAFHLFCSTGAPMSVAMIVLGYLDRIKSVIAFKYEHLACERLLLGLFIVGYKHILGCPEGVAAWTSVSTIFKPAEVELVESETLLLMDHDVGLSLDELTGHYSELLMLYPDVYWQWLSERVPNGHVYRQEHPSTGSITVSRDAAAYVDSSADPCPGPLLHPYDRVETVPDMPVPLQSTAAVDDGSSIAGRSSKSDAFLRSLGLPTDRPVTSLEKLLAIKRLYPKKPVITTYGRGRPRRSVRLVCKESVAERK